MKIYKDEYGKIEKCIFCNKEYILKEIDKEEPLEVYECECHRKRYKSLNGYEG